MLPKPLALFLPHHSNNLKAKVLHHQSLLVLLGLFIMAQSALSVFSAISPDILGYASQIPPTAIIELTNQERQKEGLPPLRENSTLSTAAAAKAADMFNKDYWAHNAPDGTEPWTFILNSGYSYLHAGENLARDFSNPSDVVDAWMKSSSHKANIISQKYQDIGIAVVDGQLNGVETTLVVQMFGTAQAAAPQVVDSQTAATGFRQVLAEQSIVLANTQPLLSPFDVSRSISLAFVILIVVALAFDWLIVWRRNIIRISGKSWAHLTYFLTLIIILILLKQGIIL